MSASKTKEAPVQAVAEDAPPATPDEESSEIDRLDPVPSTVTLQSGFVLDVAALKTRQFFKLLRILTRGGANVLPNFHLTSDMSAEEFGQNLVGLVIFAIPEAEDETLEFLRSMTSPQGLTGNPKADEPVLKQYFEELANPELDDSISIIEVIVRRESEDLLALGKRLMTLFKVAEKSGQTTPLKTASSEDSPARST